MIVNPKQRSQKLVIVHISKRHSMEHCLKINLSSKNLTIKVAERYALNQMAVIIGLMSTEKIPM